MIIREYFQKKIQPIYLWILLASLVSNCNISTPVNVSEKANLQINPYVGVQKLEGEWEYYPNFIKSQTGTIEYSNPLENRNQPGLYRITIKSPDYKKYKYFYLKFFSLGLDYQIYWNGNLVFSKIPGLIDRYNNTQYLQIFLEKEINQLELVVFPFSQSPFSGIYSLEYIPPSEYSGLRINEVSFEMLIIILFLTVMGFALFKVHEKYSYIILTNLVLGLCFFLLNSFGIIDSFFESEENIPIFRVIFKILLILSQFSITWLLFHTTREPEKKIKIISYLIFSIGNIFFYDFLIYGQVTRFAILILHGQVSYLLWKNHFSDYKSLSELKTYADNYKEELGKVKKELVDYKLTFHQKILDKSYYLVTYMEKLEIQTMEIEKLNELIVQLMDGSNMDAMLDSIFNHMIVYYKADIAFLYFLDQESKEFFAYRGMSKNIPEDLHKFMKNARMPISREAGLSYLAYKKKRIIYKENTKTKYNKPAERNIQLMLPEVLSSLYIPIIIRNEFQGIFFLSSFNHSMNLNKEKLKYISMFTNQVSSAIQKDRILKEMESEKKKVEAERERAEKMRLEAESAKKEIEAINLLAKSINENLEIKVIMEKIMNFADMHYGIKYYSLYIINFKKTKVKMLEAKFPENIDKSTKKKIMDISIPVDQEKGAHAFIYKTGKMVYFKRLNTTHTCPEEEDALKYLNITSMVGIPLKVKGEIIGILSFFSPSEMKLSKHQLKTLSNLGDQIAGAIHNSKLYKEINSEKDKSEQLLLSILPPKIAEELKNTGKVVPEIYESATILFTDFVGFTKIAERLLPKQLLIELDGFFTFFDFICEKYNLEKLKTIGDSYMCAGGLPIRNFTHPIDACLAAMEFRDFSLRMQELAAVSKEENIIPWELRIGIHTGPAIGGVVGTTKFAYDVWGDSVNTASRVESSGMPNRINVSGETYHLVKEIFAFEYRGKVSAKNKGTIDMYFLNGIRPEFSENGEGLIPNQEFWDYHKAVMSGEKNLFNQNKLKLVI